MIRINRAKIRYKIKEIKISLIVLFFPFLMFSQQSDFENVLGEKNVESLNSLIDDFENNYLNKVYPKLEVKDAYKKYLVDLVRNGMKLDKNSSITNNVKRFNKTALKLDVFCLADTVYVDRSDLNTKHIKEDIITVYNCKRIDGKIFERKQTTPYYKNTLDIDYEIIKSKNTKVFNLDGLFFKALQKASLKPNNIQLKEYIHNINNTAHLLAPYTVVRQILMNHYNTDNYFIKRIILLNVVYELNY